PGRSLGRQEDVQRLPETALQQVGVSRERYQVAPRARVLHARRDMKTMDGVEKEQGADALIEIVAGAPEAVERRALVEELFERGGSAEGVQGPVADRGFAGGNNGD